LCWSCCCHDHENLLPFFLCRHSARRFHPTANFAAWRVHIQRDGFDARVIQRVLKLSLNDGIGAQVRPVGRRRGRRLRFTTTLVVREKSNAAGFGRVFMLRDLRQAIGDEQVSQALSPALEGALARNLSTVCAGHCGRAKYNTLNTFHMIITVLAKKGGAGKSSVCVLLHEALKRAGKTVAVRDWDAQGTSNKSLDLIDGRRPR
jgi:hypothetical protein